MESLVNIIETVKNNVDELKNQLKKNTKEIAALQQENENIEKNIIMFEKVLVDLNTTRDTEVNKELGKEEKKEPKTKNWQRPVIFIDGKDGSQIEYPSQSEAARELGIKQKTLWNRIAHMDKQHQLKRFGYAFING